MKISVYTYSVTRSAGGVLDAVRDLFMNKVFEKQELTFFSYMDEFVEMDLPQWEDLDVKLFTPGLFLYSDKLNKAILNFDTDVLHMQALWRYPHVFMAKWKSIRSEPIVCSPHGMLDSWILEKQGVIKRQIAKLFFQKGLMAVDCFHALCQKEYNDIKKYGLSQPIAIIPNGVNLPAPEDYQKFKNSDNKRHLLYLGRLHPKKGVDLLIESIADIKRRNCQLLEGWVVDIVGWDHENTKVKLDKIVKDNGLEEYVIFHGGLFGDNKASMYANADAYILPSHGEGLPMTILEAWSWNVPVVMTEKCNIPEGFNANAAIHIDDTVSSTTQGIELLLNMSDSERSIMGRNGYQLVVDEFTWDRSAKKMLELYKWLTKRGSKPDFVYE